MNLHNLVVTNINKLNENDLQIWNFISNNKNDCCNYTIDQLGKKCNVSRTTILRFAQKLSLSGFSELKVYLKMDCANKTTSKFNIKSYIDESFSNITTIDKNVNFDNICQLIQKAKKIYIYGTGSFQNNIAKELKRSFLHANIIMSEIEGSSVEAELTVDALSKDDLMIIISLSGESSIAVNLGKKLKAKQIPFVSMTRFESNTLANYSTENIYVNTFKMDIPGKNPFETIGTFFFVGELLILKYFEYCEKNPIFNK